MPHAENTVTINRSAADVFAFLADGENAKQWWPGIVEIKKVSGEGVGATYKQTLEGGGRSFAGDYRVTEFEPNRLIAFESIAGPVRPRGRYVLNEHDGSTTVSFILDAEVGGLMMLTVAGMIEKGMQAEVNALPQLKTVLEA